MSNVVVPGYIRIPRQSPAAGLGAACERWVPRLFARVLSLRGASPRRRAGLPGVGGLRGRREAAAMKRKRKASDHPVNTAPAALAAAKAAVKQERGGDGKELNWVQKGAQVHREKLS